MKLLPFILLGFSSVASAAPITHHAAVSIAIAGHTRQYLVDLLDDSCGKVSSKSSGAKLEDTFDDEVSLCSQGGSLKVDWMTRQGDKEIHMASTLTVGTAPVTIEGGDAKLTLKLS